MATEINKEAEVKKTDTKPADAKTAEAKTGGRVPFAVVEAYKTIRTNLMFMMSQSKKKRFVISSSNPGEGKSTTAINIAISFSQLGSRVLLIDADLRKPSIHKKMKLQNQKGLSSVLVGFVDYSEVVNKINSSLDVITSGPMPPNPSELMSSESMTNLLNTLQDRYDYIIIDTPPMNVVSDALVLAPKTNGIVMVIQDYVTTHDEIKKSLASIEFANVKLLGVIMNGSGKGKGSKYRYRYSKSYKKYSYVYKN